MGPTLRKVDAFEQRQDLVGSEARLGFFLCHMQLQKHIDARVTESCLALTTETYSLALHFVEQTLRVNRLDKAHVRGNVLHLVGLQMPDEVPLDVVGQGGNLDLELVLTTFAEDALPGIVCLLQSLYGVELAHSHQRYAFGNGGAYGL